MDWSSVDRQKRVRRLARVLRGLQREEQLTIEDMAVRLGVSSSMLAMVYCGRRSPGHKFLHGVLHAYPALRDEVYHFLLRDFGDWE
ncbi:MAG: helix-turn-helix transcriptional regulator [Planctomycetota bacterium]|nr:helix-turn-helix transcriptional regulator [Planctomycetota bacterium]